MTDSLLNIATKFERISLPELQSEKLMDRVDEKYVFHANSLAQILSALIPYYHILQTNKELEANYQTTYFDTKDFLFYHNHINQKTNRNKVRIRSYLDVNQHFLEVKFKNNKGQTFKKRLERNNSKEEFCEQEKAFIKKHTAIDASLIKTKTNNQFKRISLLNQENEERVTIDTNIRFYHKEKEYAIDNLVICEVKKLPSQEQTQIENILQKNRIKKLRISKYCLGLYLSEENLKKNRYKEKYRKIHKYLHLSNDNNTLSFHP